MSVWAAGALTPDVVALLAAAAAGGGPEEPTGAVNVLGRLLIGLSMPLFLAGGVVAAKAGGLVAMGTILMSKASPFLMGSVNWAGCPLTKMSTVTRLVAGGGTKPTEARAVETRVARASERVYLMRLPSAMMVLTVAGRSLTSRLTTAEGILVSAPL